MPLVDGLPSLPDLPIGNNSTNNTITVPGLGEIPAPFDILGILTFSQTSFTMLSSFYIAWQNLTQKVRDNENLGLNIIASLNHRSESITEVENEEGETTSHTEALVSQYKSIAYRIQALNNKPFLQRWFESASIAGELRQFNAEAEKLYQLYLIKVNVAIYVDADRARNGVEDLQKKMDKVMQLLTSKTS